jgi:hypothetical protein
MAIVKNDSKPQLTPGDTVKRHGRSTLHVVNSVFFNKLYGHYSANISYGDHDTCNWPVNELTVIQTRQLDLFVGGSVSDTPTKVRNPVLNGG